MALMADTFSALNTRVHLQTFTGCITGALTHNVDIIQVTNHVSTAVVAAFYRDDTFPLCQLRLCCNKDSHHIVSSNVVLVF